MEQLTEAQQRVYGAIVKFISNFKISPTIRDICDLTGLKSKATVKEHMLILERKGYIVCTPKKMRGVYLVNEGEER